VVLGASFLRLAYVAAGDLDLSPDEAHYWEWSRRLDLSYYSKGPLIAYLMRALTVLLGDSALALRAGAVALGALAAWALYRLGRDATGDGRAGALAVIGLQVTPLVWAGSLLLTIDAPFLACWTLALLAFHRALATGSAAAWAGLGAAVGLGFLAKYAMLFFLPGLGLYLLAAPEARRRLSGAGPWLAALVAALLVSPVVAWNLRQGWVSARHVAAQGRGSGATLRHLGEFLGSQAILLSPLVALLLAWGLAVALRRGLAGGREPYRLLVAFAAPVLGFYLLLALQSKVQANWAAAAYPSLALATGAALVERWDRLVPPARRAQRRLLGAAGAVALGMVVLAHALGPLVGLLGLPPRLDPTLRLRGWRQLGETVGTLRAGMPAPDRTFLVSDRYQVTSELAFYTPGHPPAYNFNLGRRLNQYDLWPGPEAHAGWDAIYVQEGAREPDPRARAAFDRWGPPAPVEVRLAGRVVRRFTAYPAFGFRAAPAPAGPARH
jgi:undecaprenyl-diphosphatase